MATGVCVDKGGYLGMSQYNMLSPNAIRFYATIDLLDLVQHPVCTIVNCQIVHIFSQIDSPIHYSGSGVGGCLGNTYPWVISLSWLNFFFLFRVRLIIVEVVNKNVYFDSFV